MAEPVPTRTAYHILDVHLPDERGALAVLARTLAEANVNIDGFVANRGGVQLLTRHADQARKALDGAAYHYQSRAVEEVKLAEKPGSLAGLCERLAWDWTSIESGFGLATGNSARVFLQVKQEPGQP